MDCCQLPGQCTFQTSDSHAFTETAQSSPHPPGLAPAQAERGPDQSIIRHYPTPAPCKPAKMIVSQAQLSNGAKDQASQRAKVDWNRVLFPGCF